MTVRPDIVEFVAAVESFSNRKLHHPAEIGELLQIAVQTGLIKEFEELVFQAKFLTRTQDVMRQIGNSAEGYDKLLKEFGASQKKSIDLVQIMLRRAAPDVQKHVSDLFLSIESDSFARQMNLYTDLSWIKNWQIDGKPLPYETKPPTTSDKPDVLSLKKEEFPQAKDVLLLFRIMKIAILTAGMFILFLLLDPPVTIGGWILSLGIAAMLAYIVIQIILFARKP